MSTNATAPTSTRHTSVWIALFAMGLTLLSLPARAAIDLPSVPLQSGASVPPNIMFILDDSGSMQFEQMPDQYIFGGASGSMYLFPRANGIYGSTDYDNRVVTVDNDNPYNALARSPQGNGIYYNPSVTYTPWSRSDGTLFPPASLTCALHNPRETGTGQANCRNLTVVNDNYNGTIWRSCNSNGNCNTVTTNKNFWPAKYFWHNGDDLWDWDDYTQVQIRDTTPTYSGHGRQARTDCANAAIGECTYAEEIQNFANWYTYYRSRVLAARAGIGRAFSQLAEPTAEAPAARVGYGALNKGASTIDGVSTDTIVNGVRSFTGTARQNFFTQLYDRAIPASGTPLRRALNSAGRYYSREDELGPWSETPGEADGEDLSCRQSFSILMTDGYWSHGTASDAGTAGARANVDNTDGDEITGPDGESYTYEATGPFSDAHDNTLADVAMYYWKRDLHGDLANRVPTSALNPAFWQHMVTFGVGLGVTGSVDPDTAFAAIETGATINWADPDSANESANPAKIDDLLHAAVNSRGGFFSAQNPTEFAEELQGVLTSIVERTSSASNVSTNSTSLDDGTRVYQASFVAGRWTGELRAFPVTAAGVGATPVWRASEQLPAAEDRNIFTNIATTTGSNAVGAEFVWASLPVGGPLRIALRDGESAAQGRARLDYLRGVQDDEIQNSGQFRSRTSVLGDIVNSSPVLLREGGLDPSSTLFVGSNGGMLHAFDPTTGEELFAYVPRHVNWNGLADLSNPNYAHAYFVDGEIAVSTRAQTSDRNILVGSLGRGGKALYALDVTDPENFEASDVLWEFTHPELGNVLGKPVIARLDDGTMAAIVGNGYNSDSNEAGLFIINLETGALIKHIETGEGDDGEPNGLTTPRGWDADANGSVDYVYAGDLLGNMWKFDLTHNNSNQWDVDFGGDPLFVARDGAGNRQPITGGVSIGLDPQSYRRWIFFGTGRYLTTGDPGNLNMQTWYGIIDDNDAITDPRGTALLERSVAVEETIDGTNYRAFEEGDATELVGKQGWFIDLKPMSGTPNGERIISDTLLIGGILLSASIIPTDDPCEVGGNGYVNVLDPFTGASVGSPFFDVDGDGSFGSGDMIGVPQIPVGSVDLGVGMPTLPAIIRQLLIGGGSSGETGSIGIDDPTDTGRISWREIVRD